MKTEAIATEDDIDDDTARQISGTQITEASRDRLSLSLSRSLPKISLFLWASASAANNPHDHQARSVQTW